MPRCNLWKVTHSKSNGPAKCDKSWSRFGISNYRHIVKNSERSDSLNLWDWAFHFNDRLFGQDMQKVRKVGKGRNSIDKTRGETSNWRLESRQTKILYDSSFLGRKRKTGWADEISHARIYASRMNYCIFNLILQLSYFDVACINVLWKMCCSVLWQKSFSSFARV